MCCSIKIRNEKYQEDYVPISAVFVLLRQRYIKRILPQEIPPDGISIEEIIAVSSIPGLQMTYSGDRKMLYLSPAAH